MTVTDLVGGPPTVLPADSFELASQVVRSRFTGNCVIDSSHYILRGKKTAKVRLASNPMSLRQGYACADCVDRIKSREAS